MYGRHGHLQPVLAAHPSPDCPSISVEEIAIVCPSFIGLYTDFSHLTCPFFLAMGARGRWFTSTLALESEPTSCSGCDGNRGLHVRVNVAVIGEGSCRSEGEHESLIRVQITGGT